MVSSEEAKSSNNGNEITQSIKRFQNFGNCVATFLILDGRAKRGGLRVRYGTVSRLAKDLSNRKSQYTDRTVRRTCGSGVQLIGLQLALLLAT